MYFSTCVSHTQQNKTGPHTTLNIIHPSTHTYTQRHNGKGTIELNAWLP